MIRTSGNHSPRILVIGVGNPYRSDDGAGISVIRLLKELDMPGIIFLEHRGEGTSLMEAIKNYRSVYLVDAVQAGTAPGEIIRFEAHSESLPAQFSASSTHSFGVAEAIEMLRMLGELPQRLIVFGVQGFNFAVGTRMSPEVEQAVPHLVDVICQELSMAEIEE